VELARHALAVKAEELEVTSRYKSEFLANMSHELRTPLNSVLILTRLLADNKTANLNEKQIEYANIIHKSGNDLLHLINDILDLSKIESGKLELNIELVSLKKLKQDIAEAFAAQAEDKGLKLEIIAEPDITEVIQTDKMRLEQVIKNLLSNALKFTPKGGEIILSFRNERNFEQSHSTDILVIEVKDTGIGVAPEKQKLIFEAFQQADGSTSRKYGGTGLGLSISRELVKKLGGDIKLVSNEGEGSTFTIYLPVSWHAQSADLQGLKADSDSQQVLPKDIQQQPAETLEPFLYKQQEFTQKEATGTLTEINNNKILQDKLVLLVDDDMRNVFALTTLLEEHKMIVLTAGDGKEAIEQLKTNNGVDIVLMDVMMPGMDGYDAMKEIRQNPKYQDLPLIALTAKAMPGDQKKCMEAGASDYITKPVDSVRLFSLMRVWLSQ